MTSVAITSRDAGENVLTPMHERHLINLLITLECDVRCFDGG